MSEERVCPPWIGYFLASPIRKLVQNPRKLLAPYVKEGMTVLDVGSAMGFFTLPLAQLVGIGGKVIAVDLQPKMIEVLERRAGKKGLADRIETRVCPADSLGVSDLAGKIDLALAFAMMHEVPDQSATIKEIAQTLKSGGILYIAEPKGHVTPDGFARTTAIALENGMTVIANPRVRNNLALVLKKNLDHSLPNRG